MTVHKLRSVSNRDDKTRTQRQEVVKFKLLTLQLFLLFFMESYEVMKKRLRYFKYTTIHICIVSMKKDILSFIFSFCFRCCCCFGCCSCCETWVILERWESEESKCYPKIHFNRSKNLIGKQIFDRKRDASWRKTKLVFIGKKKSVDILFVFDIDRKYLCIGKFYRVVDRKKTTR